MALTSVEKKTLDGFIAKEIEEMTSGDYIIDINEWVAKYHYPVVSLLASLNRVRDYGLSDVEYRSATKKIYYGVGQGINVGVRTVRKERNILHFDCLNGLDYDFQTGKFNQDITKIRRSDRIFDDILLKMLKYEWLFNYIDNVDDIKKIYKRCSEDMYRAMPAGLASALVDRTLTPDLLQKYYLSKTYGKYAGIVTYALSYYNNNENYMSTITNFIKEVPFDNFMKLIKNDMVDTGMSIISYSHYELFDFAKMYLQTKELSPNFTLDFNRNTEKNKELMKAIVDAEKNALLAKRLQKLNFINDLVIGNYTVIVPQSQDDKVDEGKQQNNCVGYYYDNSILDGENLIYFIRKNDNIKHSYITCRYRLSDKRTVEARKVNNTSIANKAEENLILDIDKIIREGLAE